jgi:hypothetical protein
MKPYLFSLLLLAVSLGSAAQHNHFVYVQTDNKQPFYIRVNEKLYSSSPAGYVVIPKMTKGDYIFTIGFPKNEWPQQTIPVSVNADLGFSLKNFAEKGWGLFNIQNLEVLMASANSTSAPRAEQKQDAFSNVLADVVNTPSLKDQEVKAAPKTEIKTAEPPKTEIKLEPREEIKAVVVTPVIETTPNKEMITQPIKLLHTGVDVSGRTATYLDGGTDTIRIFIDQAAEPLQLDSTIKPISAGDVAANNVKPAVTTEQAKVEPTLEDKRFLNINVENPNSVRDSSKVPGTARKEVVPATIDKPAPAVLTFNSDCKAVASDNDFLKLRKKMASEDNDDDMIAAARKVFRSKCYSTEQVKNLGLLFLKDEGRYKFFDAAYPFVHDTQNFKELQLQLTDEYFITRFKAMIRQ